jgi:hypothetical protein
VGAHDCAPVLAANPLLSQLFLSVGRPLVPHCGWQELENARPFTAASRAALSELLDPLIPSPGVRGHILGGLRCACLRWVFSRVLSCPLVLVSKLAVQGTASVWCPHRTSFAATCCATTHAPLGFRLLDTQRCAIDLLSEFPSLTSRVASGCVCVWVRSVPQLIELRADGTCSHIEWYTALEVTVCFQHEVRPPA